MIDNFRYFEVSPDPFGRRWLVQFRWQQTAISIRHSDSVDVKFQISTQDQGQDVVEEKVIALMHPDLLTLSESTKRPLTDAWCLKLAGLHLREVLLTGEDMDKTLITCTLGDLERHAKELAGSKAA